MTGVSIAALLTEARRLGLARLDAQQLLAHVLGQPRAWLIAHDEDEVPAPRVLAFRDLAGRRAAGEPFAYLVGEKEFRGLRLRVTPAVLVPRPDTETLVEWALELLQQGPLKNVTQPEVLDLGTGSGAIALAVKHAVPRAAVTALDASASALEVAQDNARRLGLQVRFLASDWWDAVRDRHWHLALSNPPYIAEGDPHLADLRHEPTRALTSGSTGLDDIERLLLDAVDHLVPGGWLLMEHGHDQGPAVRERLLRVGFDSVETRRDLAGHERCTGGAWNRPRAACTNA